MKKFKRKDIELRIIKDLKEFGYSKKKREEIAFHMTDWLDDLVELNALYADPKKCKLDGTDFLTNFMIHVPNHIFRAAKLMLGYEPVDIFEDKKKQL